MSIRPRRIPIAPPSGNARVDQWMNEVTDALNGLPFSVFSTSGGPNASNVTAPKGFIGFEIGSSSTKLWVKTSGGGGAGWSAISTI